MMNNAVTTDNQNHWRPLFYSIFVLFRFKNFVCFIFFRTVSFRLRHSVYVCVCYSLELCYQHLFFCKFNVAVSFVEKESERESDLFDY